MDKIWLQHYPAGMPATVDASRYPSLKALVEESVAQYADRDAYVCMGKTLTFRALDGMSRAFAAWLQSKGLGGNGNKGARVAVMMPNVLQYPVAIFGILRAGCTVVNVNPLYTPRELEHQLKDSGAEAIVILENFATTLEAVVARTRIKHVVVASLGDLLGLKGLLVNFAVRHVKSMVPAFTLDHAIRFNRMVGEGMACVLEPVDVGPFDAAFLQYTGGTTGVSKGATLLNRNIVANILQSEAWMAPALMRAQAQGTVAVGEALNIVTALPLYHIFSLTVNCLLYTRIGGKNILIVNPKDIPGFVRELAKHTFHMFTGVNTLFNALLNHPNFAKLDFSRSEERRVGKECA